MANCKHKFVYSRSDSYWKFEGRNSRSYYHADYYFCGPKPFMVNIYHELLKWGIPGSQVHFEFFGPRQELENTDAKAA